MISDGSFRLDGKLALVTGASRGIGYSLSKELAARGAHVIAVARTVGGLEELDDEIKEAGGTATLVPLDLTDMPAIDRLGGSIHERWGRLDIMVANAGILGTISPIGHVEAKVFDRLMAINVTSVWRLIRTTDPLLKLADAGRAILLSSGVAHTARAYWGPYAASKAAVEVMARTWAEESQQTRLCINSVDPGATRTAMRAQAMPGEDPETLPTPAEVAQKIALLCDPALNATGKLYDVRTGKFLSYNDPS
ncbi:NAD(P)-dependent dehydrogenase (short-subunit alcohol dehydrogenase family) [Phyllobacterium sp. 1468]|uniref:SDR family NAD(P)-dependent oxidoreductase n=1 Tax=Phyllobacterium sp. 1468 TaxID=2817759 RepID=UPI00286668A1|nr:SDR family NAD(P)-dependent oxidoreductase [Phyllobacterium sp. 1468]MDR6633941.1 NAD(P)-dependent dehydrogenase (short-subunit alcohol dehydrogenase family) [Phyllobacterium sp. 1468]